MSCIMNVMKILYVTHSPIIGGAETSLLSHIRTIDKEKFDITLVCSDVLYEKASEIKGIEVITMQFYLLHGFSPLRLFNYFKMVKRLVNIVRTKHIDIIHSNSVKAHYITTLVSFITHVYLVWWIRDDTMSKFIFKLSRRIPKSIVFVSYYLSYLYPKYPNTVVIHNGTPAPKHLMNEQEKETMKRLHGAGNKAVILCVERLVVWKGVQILLEALANVQYDYTCLIVGSGKNQRDDCEFDLIKQTAELGLTEKVQFLGWRDSVENYYQISDILIHPALKPEPFGLVVIEAMTHGIPVIATNVGGPVETILDGETGFLVPAGDTAALTEKINLILGNRQLAEVIGRNAKEIAMQTYIQEIETKKIEELYTKLISQ